MAGCRIFFTLVLVVWENFHAQNGVFAASPPVILSIGSGHESKDSILLPGELARMAEKDKSVFTNEKDSLQEFLPPLHRLPGQRGNDLLLSPEQEEMLRSRKAIPRSSYHWTEVNAFNDNVRLSKYSKIITSETVITSPLYPSVTPVGEMYTKWIQAHPCKLIRLTFNAFNTYPRVNDNGVLKCLYEGLEIRTSDMLDGTWYCGSEITTGQQITSTGNQMMVFFKSYITGHTGAKWSANVTFVPGPSCLNTTSSTSTTTKTSSITSTSTTSKTTSTSTTTKTTSTTKPTSTSTTTKPTSTSTTTKTTSTSTTTKTTSTTKPTSTSTTTKPTSTSTTTKASRVLQHRLPKKLSPAS